MNRKKEQMGGRKETEWMDAQVSGCQVAVGQLRVTPLPSCHCDHQGGLAHWLREIRDCGPLNSKSAASSSEGTTL